MIDRVESQLNIKPQRLLADSAYGSAAMLNWVVEEKHIAPHIPVWDKSQNTPGLFRRNEFIWNTGADHYTCPSGKLLKSSRRNFTKPRGRTVTKANIINYSASQYDRKLC